MGSSGSARRYSRNHCCFLFLWLLRCFSSPGSPPYVMDWRKDTGGLLQWVSPFRYLRIIGYLLLPEAFRSLSRLSSALSAKASTICSFHHDQNVDIALSTLVSRLSVLCFFSRNLLGCLFSLRFFLVCGFQGTLQNNDFARRMFTSVSGKICCFIACLHATERTKFSRCNVVSTLLTDVLSVIRSLDFRPTL